MKRNLLLLLAIGLTNSVFCQTPPPCGLSPIFLCDADGDGFEEFDLVATHTLESFCGTLGKDPEDYSITFHLTEEDANLGVNPIANPTSYINVVQYSQIVHCRAEAIADSNQFFYKEDSIHTKLDPTPNSPTPLIICDINGNGYNTFNLYTKRQEILAGQDNYQVRFYETYVDAENFMNAISTVYTNTIPYAQTLYANVFVIGDTNCSEIVELDLIVQGTCQDLSVSLVNNWASPRPGFNYANRVFIRNTGSQDIASGSVEFIMDDDLLLNSASVSHPNFSVTATTSGFILDFVDFEIDGYGYVTISLNCPASTPLGTPILNTARYITNEDDVVSANDDSWLSEVVIGSYDPNDILESHGPEIVFDEFTSSDYLFYTIRFQNVGTAEAINVRIEDILDDAKLEKSTFFMLNASHSYSVERIGNNITWQFDDIYLPSESMDESNSHGFVNFKIKPKAGYAVNDIVPNSAAIYFDFNAPVITNTFETKFVEELLSQDDFEQLGFKMQPNPTSNILNFSFKDNNVLNINISVNDISGKRVLESTNTSTIDVSKLDAGMYFVTVDLGNNQITKKLIVW